MHCIDSANASARTLLQTSGDMPDGGALDLATVPHRREALRRCLRPRRRSFSDRVSAMAVSSI